MTGALNTSLKKLNAADGAPIVDLMNPHAAPTTARDGVVTGLEVHRTPAIYGMTTVALLKYAASL